MCLGKTFWNDQAVFLMNILEHSYNNHLRLHKSEGTEHKTDTWTPFQPRTALVASLMLTEEVLPMHRYLFGMTFYDAQKVKTVPLLITMMRWEEIE